MHTSRPRSADGVGRREFLRAGAVTGVVLLAASLPLAASAATNAVFRHGVASGDPLPDRVILWTRITPSDEASPGSGLGPAVQVGWQVAEDAGFSRIVARGTVRTGPQVDHTVKVDAAGLAPDRWYFYRFTVSGQRSPVGRTRTAPALNSTPERLRFGIVSCSNWQAGHFSAYRHLAERDDLDAVLHLGDYLYEYGPGEYGSFRPHDPPHEMITLADYRMRHAQYKTDPNLRLLHARVPWIVTWDDHESTNDSWREGAENHTEGAEGTWEQRFAWALRAYQEWMPIRFGPGARMYRRLRFGRLAELTMLDLRSYRDEPIDYPNTPSAGDADRTMTGPEQLAFLREALLSADVQWKLIGNPVMFAPLLMPPLPQIVGKPLSDLTGTFPTDGAPFNGDQWDGYQHERRGLISHIADNGVTDTLFLTGDIHTSWAIDVPLDAGLYPLSRTVATEFVVPSVTSDNIDEIVGAPPRTASITVEGAVLASNRHVKWVELDSHGYSVLDVSAERAQMDWYFIADREDPDSTSTWAKSFAVAAGTQQVREVRSPVM